MYDLGKQDSIQPKCLFTRIELPKGTKIDQWSTKKNPFAFISRQPLTHTLEILIPKAASQAFQQALSDENETLQYAKVHMKLRDVISGDFFNHYIKSGNIIMLSAGRPGVDPIFSLIDGVLRLEVIKPTYERLGLAGKPVPHDGRKHIVARYAVEVNLRLPSMVHGRRGFERVVFACDNALPETVTWLFCDRRAPTDGTGPIAAHQPLLRRVEPHFQDLDGVNVPAFPLHLGQDDFVEAGELLEWLSLVFHDSPRVRKADEVDPVLSRYQVPDWFEHDSGEDGSAAQDLVKVQWRGLITPDFVLKVLLAGLKMSRSRWMALNALHFNGEAYAGLFKDNQSLLWDYKD